MMLKLNHQSIVSMVYHRSTCPNRTTTNFGGYPIISNHSFIRNHYHYHYHRHSHNKYWPNWMMKLGNKQQPPPPQQHRSFSKRIPHQSLNKSQSFPFHFNHWKIFSNQIIFLSSPLTTKTITRPFSNTSSEFLPPYVDETYSYAHGRSTKSLVYKTIGQFLEDRLNKESRNLKPLIVSHHEGIRKTLVEFNEDVNRLARAMYETMALQQGDVVGLWGLNTYNWIVVQYACAKIGVILCTINPFYQVQELDYVLRKADCKALFMPGKNSKQQTINKFEKILASTLTEKNKTVDYPLVLKNIITIDSDEYVAGDLPSTYKGLELHQLSQLQQQSGDFVLSPNITSQVVSDDPAMIMFTSGTTGKPKGACLSHFNLTNNTLLAGTKTNMTNESVFCIPLPFFHSFAGILGNISLATTENLQIVTPSLRYDVKELVDSIKENNVTHMIATPTLAIDMMNYVKKNKTNLPSLKMVFVGGASVPVEIAQQFIKIIPSCKDFRIGYGSTELSPCATACLSSHTLKQKTETVGTPLDFVEVKVIDPISKRLMKLGETGEVHTRGFNTMLCYWKEPEKTRETIDQAGWYNTGDLGTLDDQGFLRISGRTKEMIIVGGENVYPREIEELLHTHPAVLDVHVVGVPDERKGEEVCAWIKLHPENHQTITEEELKKFCKDKLSYFKVPKYVMLVEAFPMTTTGKAQKFKMRAESIKKFGLKEKA